MLPLIEAQLVTITGLSTHRVFSRLAGRQVTTHPQQGTQYIVIRPRVPSPIEGPVSSAGRVQGMKRRVLEVVCRTRLGMDTVDRDDNFLLRADDGHFALEDAVYDALEIFEPTDSTGNVLSAEPMRSLPDDGESQKSEPLDPQWGESVLLFEVKYLQALDQSRQS